MNIALIRQGTHWLSMIKQRDWQIKKKEGYKNAVKIVNRIESNDTNEAVDQMKDSLDERIHRRIEPYLELAGADIAKQIFR